VSLYRLAMPLLLAGTVFAGGLFLFDYYYVPGANLKQDAMRDEIKGGPNRLTNARTTSGSWALAHLLLRIFDHAAGVMHGVMCSTWTQYVSPEARNCGGRGQWSPALKTWLSRTAGVAALPATRAAHTSPSRASRRLETRWHSDLTEPPDYFVTAACRKSR